MAKITIPYAQYVMQAEAAVRMLRDWHEKLPPHEHIEDSCIFTYESHGDVLASVEDAPDLGVSYPLGGDRDV